MMCKEQISEEPGQAKGLLGGLQHSMKKGRKEGRHLYMDGLESLGPKKQKEQWGRLRGGPSRGSVPRTPALFPGVLSQRK